MIEITAVPGKVLMLGRQGENLARKVIFSVSGVRAEFGDGAFRLSARRAGESNVYPAAVTENGDTVEWSLTAADTQNAGRGSCELAYYAGDVRLKTWVYDTAVAKSLTGSPETDPYDEFLDEVNRLAAEAAISQREAKNSENAAKNSEENAKASENAAKSAEDNAAAYAQAALAAESKSKQNAEYAASAATAAGQYAQNAATSATNAASSASAAETHEKGAKDAATAAAKSAEGLADAVKRAKDAAANAQDSAGKTAADREAVAKMKTAAQTAQGNAEKAATAAAAEKSKTGAAEIKTQIDKIKAGIDTTKGEIDQAKADIDQTKTDTLAAKTAAETAATTATEKAAEIADSAAQIATNTENIGKNATGIKTNATEIDLLRRENVELRAKTDALWKLSEGKSYDFIEGSAEAYSKNVPAGCRFAQIEKIGGKTGAWNQWVDETKYADATSASVTTTISGRRIVIVGTSGSNGENFNIISRSTKIWNIAANHYYLFAGINKLTGLSLSAYNGAKAVTIAYAGSTAKNAVFKPAFSGISQLYLNTGDAGVAVDVDCAPYLIDLTQLFGSGNEPTTTDDPRIAEIIAYAEKHPAYNAGELVSAGVEDVEVQGANLVDIVDAPVSWATKIRVSGPVTRLRASDLVSGYAKFVVTSVKDGAEGECEFRILVNNGARFSYLTTKRLEVPPQVGDTIEMSFSMKAGLNNIETLYLYGFGREGTPIMGTSNLTLTLVKGTSIPLGQIPYSLNTYLIPDAVKALPGYGQSAGDLCNEIVRRADGWDYVQRVGLPATADGYTALDAPTTTDITDLMTGALPLVTTEPGGTITMHHALADGGLPLDVPNTVKYIRDLKEVASSGTE
jgi:hypothetical protein